jgi:hypothetical protein
METSEFEKKLHDMSKPEIDQLSHQNLVAHAISQAKDKSIVGLWWLAIPAFLIAMLWMKSTYMPQQCFFTILKETISGQPPLMEFIFYFVPVTLTVLNAWTIKKVNYLLGGPGIFKLFQAVGQNVVMILLALFILSLLIISQ